MKKALLASALMLAALPAFAQSASTSVGLNAEQDTQSMSVVKNGGVAIGGAVAGNYTDVTGTARASRNDNTVKTNANVTGTQVGGVIDGAYTKGNAKVVSSGDQSSNISGNASANATVPQHRRW